MSERPAPDPATVVLTFLESVGRRVDAEFYLRLFRDLPKESFAVIAAEASLPEHALGALEADLGYLHQLGLFAPVVLGLFEPELAERGALRLSERCRALDPRVHSATEEGLFERVRHELLADRLPIVSCRHADTDARFEWLGAFAASLGTRKIVVLRLGGGLGPRGGSTLALSPGQILSTHEGGISIINLTTDYEPLLSERILSDAKDVELLRQLRRLLFRSDLEGTLASIASPLNLLKELFTVRGAGTLVKRGTPIERHESYETLDRRRLERLLASSFVRPLSPSFFQRPSSAIYLEERYRGAALLESTRVAPFLTKFAVERTAQGEGIGRDLWQALIQDHSTLFWRARPENPIGAWYGELCDGMMRTDSWVVFWRGLEPDRVPSAITEARARPDDFELTE